MRFTTIFLFLFLFLGHTFIVAQEPGKTKILYSGDVWEFNKAIWPEGPRLIGNVMMNHDSAFLYCDSAWINKNENRIIAYSNVQIQLSDSLNLYCDSLRYNGNTKIARANSNVRLIDNQTILTTDTMVYDRNTRVAQYDYWGKIVNKKNILVSHHGYYYTDHKEFFFKDRVILLNPTYTMHSDTLMYNTVSETAYFFGPSHIISKDKKDSIWCENGWYDTRTDVARFREKAKIYHENTFLTGDSMYYERRNEFGQVFRHAVLIDTAQDIILRGHYGELRQKSGFAFMTDSALAIMADKKDSLYLHADTLYARFDQQKKIRSVSAYYQVKFFRRDLQGMCDSLQMTARDSCVTMYREPVLWSDSNQLSADSIILLMRNGEADSLKMFGSAFIISRDDTASFNQIKGRVILAQFRDNELYRINVNGNAQTIYYGREEDHTLIGINTVVSSDILILLEKNKLKSILFITNPEAHTWPEKDLPREQRLLKDFKWLEERRPLKREAVFIW